MSRDVAVRLYSTTNYPVSTIPAESNIVWPGQPGARSGVLPLGYPAGLRRAVHAFHAARKHPLPGGALRLHHRQAAVAAGAQRHP